MACEACGSPERQSRGRKASHHRLQETATLHRAASERSHAACTNHRVSFRHPLLLQPCFHESSRGRWIARAVSLLSIGPGCRMGARDPDKEVETMIHRAIQNRPGQIRIIPPIRGSAIGLRISESKMPFPDHPRSIAVRLQILRKSQPFPFDEWIALNAEQHPLLQMRPPRITAGQQSITGGRATARRSVRVRENNSGSGQPFHARREKLHGIGVAVPFLIGRSVPNPHVVRKEHNNVGRHLCRRAI